LNRKPKRYWRRAQRRILLPQRHREHGVWGN
jgi:hypothetical protein